MTAQLTENDLLHFTGSETWHRHSLVRTVIYTDGIRFLAEKAGAYWLIDEIAFAQKAEQAVAAEAFQLWTLTVAADQSAHLTCEDGDGRTVWEKLIPFTDFPLGLVKVYFTDSTLLLPSEY